jgi:tetratricopeptide (TPR) repeat protein/tRNA A-37 threonylcarbamoyl transferase component Bud32
LKKELERSIIIIYQQTKQSGESQIKEESVIKRATYFFIIFLGVFPLISQATTIEERIKDLEHKMQQASGKEKVDILNQIASGYISSSADQCIRYARQAMELARQLAYPAGEANAYNNLAIGTIILGNPQKGQDYFEKALEIFDRIGDPAGSARTVNNLGSYYKRLGNFEKALEYYQKALVFEKRIGSKEGIAMVLGNIGNAYEGLNNYDKALSFQLEALKLNEELGDKNNIANTLYSVGLFYLNLERSDRALGYFQRAIKTYREVGNKNGISDSLISIGLVYKDQKKFPLALECFQEALQRAEEMNDTRGISYALGCIGSIYRIKKDYPTALDYFQRCLAMEKKTGDRWKMALTYLALGDVYIRQQDYAQALENLEQALALGKELKVKSISRTSYENLSLLYSEKGNYKTALEYYRLFYQTDKDILNEANNEQINELQAKYEAEKKAKEITLLKKNSEIQKLKLNTARITRNALIAGFILLAVIFALLFKKYLYLFAFWKKQKYIGQFRLIDKISSGGMGMVFKAHSIHDKSRVIAVKVLKDELFGDSNTRKRFKREAMIMDKLEHPHIIKIIERGEYKETLFTAMEFLSGETLESKISNQGPLELTEALPIMKQILDALTFIHGKNILHRDLKPANIMLIESDDNRDYVKLLDFGLAKMEFETRLTQSGDFLGTLEYVPPEQIINAETSPAGDIFSLGVTFYRMLCGQKPFTGETALDIMRQIINKEPPGILEIRPGIPELLNIQVMTMLAKDPGQRPSAEFVRVSLEKLNV